MNHYVELLQEVDINRVSDVKRDPVKVRSLLRSLARNTATLVEISTLEKDIRQADNNGISRPTIYDYLDALNRLMIVEDQPAWNTHIRSSASLRKSPKRHITDVCLAVAVLGLDKKELLNDLNFAGFYKAPKITQHHYRNRNKLYTTRRDKHNFTSFIGSLTIAGRVACQHAQILVCALALADFRGPNCFCNCPEIENRSLRTPKSATTSPTSQQLQVFLMV